MWIERLDEIYLLFHDWQNNRIKERVNYLSCIEGKGSLIDLHCIAKIPHYLFLYYKIFFIQS